MRQLATTGLHKAFGTHPVLRGVDLDVPAGAFTAILGPSGSGKTTLLRLLAGFERADAGTIAIGDRIVDGPGAGYVPPERRRIGYVPQEGALFPHLTVAANVGFGVPAKQRRAARTSELLAAVGLTGMGKRYPHQLSGGQQQRVALARALAISPEVVLLDEPFASLDAHMRASVRADVQRICQDAGTTAILVTHDQDEALSMADRVAVLRDGRIVQYAAPQDLYTRPADPALARFVGDANLIEGLVEAGSPAAAETILGRLQLEQVSAAALAGPGSAHEGLGGSSPRPVPVTVLVRPEQLVVEPCPQAAPRDGLAGHVVACEYYGHDAVVRVRPATHSGAQEVIIRTSGGPQLPVGESVIVRARGPVIAWPR
jgi:iron(III) transport system ATP-binding protein